MKRMIRFNQSMLHGPLLPSILSYTFPIILTSLLQLLFNAADLIVVGRFRGSLSVAAVSSTGSLVNLIITLFIGLSVGAGVSVAHALGGGQHEETRRIVHTALPTAIVGGLFLTVAGLILSEPMLRLMGTPDTVLPLSAIYPHCGLNLWNIPPERVIIHKSLHPQRSAPGPFLNVHPYYPDQVVWGEVVTRLLSHRNACGHEYITE